MPLTPHTPTRRTLLQLLGGLSIFRPAISRPAAFLLSPAFNVGQARRYRLEIDQRRDGVCALQCVMDVSLAVRARQEQGWVLDWCIDRCEVLDAQPDMRPLLSALGRFSAGFAMEVLVDAGGAVLGFVDADAVQRRMAQNADQAIEVARTERPHDPLLAQIRSVMSVLVGNRSVLDHTLLKELRMLLGGLGREYQVGEVEEVRTRVPSMFGTGEVPVLGRVSVHEARVDKREIELGWLMVIDTQTAGAVMARELAQLQPADGRRNPWAAQGAIPLYEATSRLDFDDRATLVIDLDTAWPIRGEHVRRISAGARERLERVRWTPLSR